MRLVRLAIPDVVAIEPRRHRDERGFFSEVYNRAALAAFGIDDDFVQDNQSLSVEPGVVRGLHFQKAPFAQAKLVRVLRGAIHDVAVDIRRGSPTYGKAVSRVLSAENWQQLYVPVGFAHGFCTLEPNTEVLYKVSAPYAPDHEGAIAWDDPMLDIDWPVSPDAAILSDRDRRHPALADLRSPFVFAAEAVS